MEFKEGLLRAIETMASFVIIVILLLFAFSTVAPHFIEIPRENAQLVSQQNATLQNVVLIIIAFFFGQNSGNLRKDSTIEHQSKALAAGTTTTTAAVSTTTTTKEGETNGPAATG